MKNFVPRWKSVARRAIVFSIWLVLLLGAGSGLQAQATFYTFGNPGTNDGGTVIVPDVAGFLPFGHFLIAGYTNRANGDNTFIMEVDATGAIFNQAIFKLSDPGSHDRLTDLRFDQAGDLIGCGYNFGPPNDNNGWYFKIPAALGALTWQHRIFPGPNNEVFQPFCMIEIFPGGAVPEYVLSGKRWDPTMPSENPWVAHVAAATGALTTQNWLDFPPNERADLFVNMMQFNNTLYGLGDIDFAMPLAPPNGFCRPSITSLNDNTLLTAGPGNNAYLRGLGTAAEIHATDFIDMFNDRYMCTGYGYMQYMTNNWNTFWLNRTIGGIITDPMLHMEYDFPTVESERSEEVVIYGTNQAVMLVEGKDPAAGLDIYLAGVDANNGNPNWARRYGDPVASEYLFHGSQSQMVVIGTDLFFIGIRQDAGGEDVLLVREPNVLPNIGPCVDNVPIAMSPLDLDTAFKWQDRPDFQFEDPQGQLIVTTPLPDTIVCAAAPPITCWAENDPTYQHYFASVALPVGYTLWPDRVFLDNGVIVQVPAGATLDITQADIVLDECARIEVLPGGHLRANNSTFRPCEELLTWDGIYFYESPVTTVPNASGFFNACVFKNMLNGIFINPVPVVGMTAFDVRITDNSFINCFMGVKVERSVFTEAITGNTFTVDNRGINYLPTGCASVPPYTPASPFHIGIIANNATFEGSISQNNFINTLDAGNITRLEGITFGNVNEANITLNNFTNCWHATGILQSQNIAVENNEIEITQQYNTQQTQIWFEQSTTIWVDGNHLVNSVEEYQTAVIVAAIYTEDSRRYNIKENTIEGFEVGIQAIRTASLSQILENKITNCNLAGIWIEEGVELDVACNNIKVRRHDPAGTIGIRYQTFPNAAPANMRFRGNCIFEAVTAMVFINPGGLCIPPPIIENNFLYDYSGTGMLFQFFAGNVGPPFANALTAAHNTFTSNNGGVAGFVDVTNLTPPCAIGMGGNWGIQAVSPGVAVLAPGGNAFHSYASCGMQIANNPAQIWNVEDQCDRFTDNITVFIPNIVGGDYDVFEARLAEIDHPEYAPVALFIVLHKHGVDVARPFYNHLMAGNLLTLEAKAQLRYDWLLYTGDHASAATQLALIGTTPKGTSGFMQLEQLHLKLLVEDRTWADLTPTEMQMVLDFEQSSDVNADIARAYLNLVKGDRPYLPEPIVMPTFEQGLKSLAVGTTTDHMEIFPNPSNSRLNIKFNFVNATTPVLRVTDVMGRTVYMEAMDMSAGTFTVDISAYTPGAYVVSLECLGSKSLYQHLLKF